mmetsp:Transcript_9568/g.20960  ORF Transcript_9568/g.20960 Transcript_9568/m.20960 type:complete len:220 (-) Transcript_9568:456-1115(-)
MASGGCGVRGSTCSRERARGCVSWEGGHGTADSGAVLRHRLAPPRPPYRIDFSAVAVPLHCVECTLIHHVLLPPVNQLERLPPVRVGVVHELQAAVEFLFPLIGREAAGTSSGLKPDLHQSCLSPNAVDVLNASCLQVFSQRGENFQNKDARALVWVGGCCLLLRVELFQLLLLQRFPQQLGGHLDLRSGGSEAALRLDGTNIRFSCGGGVGGLHNQAP